MYTLSHIRLYLMACRQRTSLDCLRALRHDGRSAKHLPSPRHAGRIKRILPPSRDAFYATCDKHYNFCVLWAVSLFSSPGRLAACLHSCVWAYPVCAVGISVIFSPSAALSSGQQPSLPCPVFGAQKPLKSIKRLGLLVLFSPQDRQEQKAGTLGQAR